MKLNDVMKIASAAYYNDGLDAYWDFDNDCVIAGPYGGDSLAKFIVRELSDTYDARATTQQQLAEACRVMSRAARELQEVVAAFEAKGGGE